MGKERGHFRVPAYPQAQRPEDTHEQSWGFCVLLEPTRHASFLFNTEIIINSLDGFDKHKEIDRWLLTKKTQFYV